MYDLLDDTKKDSLIRNALTKASALERANRTKESDVVKAQLIKGKKALLKIFNSKTPKKEKQEILSELAGNPQVPVSDFRAAQKAVEGVSKDFLESSFFEIEVAGERYGARPSLRAFYDPKGKRVRM